jgi:hypothetical protein
MWRVLLVAVVGWASASTAEAPRISAEKLGADRWRLTVTAPGPTDPAQTQALLNDEARKLCASKEARFGRYRFESEQELDQGGALMSGVLTFVQDLDCGGAGAPAPALSPGAVAERSEAGIAGLTERFLAALFEGEPQVAYDLATADMHGGMTPPEWAERVSADRAKVGKVTARRVAKITWYDNPPQAPEPGLYAAADYVVEAEKLHFECGYVVWRLGSDDRWRAVRHERGVLGKADVDDASPERLAEYRSMLRCPD